MKDIEKLKAIIGWMENELNADGIDEPQIVAAGPYGEQGHVGDDDEDVVGMLYLDEELSDGTIRTWNVRVTLDQ